MSRPPAAPLLGRAHRLGLPSAPARRAHCPFLRPASGSPHARLVPCSYARVAPLAVLQRKIAGRKDAAKIDSKITEQAATGRFLAYVTSRPGQSGRVDGYILEGKELEFYQRKMKK